MSIKEELLHYHSPGNRYAYYPSAKSWKKSKPDAPFSFKGQASLYIHLPFCENLCTFCGCNIRISKRAEDHLDYIKALKAEWELLKASPQSGAFIEELTGHPLESLIFGGGTPSVLHPLAQEELLKFLQSELPHGIKDGLTEASPQSFTKEFQALCHELGIKRFSFGVQDFNEDITANVNRHQSLTDIERALSLLTPSDQAGIDLIWGLPHQKRETMREWRRPLKDYPLHWVSFYPLAKVGWLETYQNAFGDFTLPELPEKYALFEEGVDALTEANFEHFAFGHFISKDGGLFQAFKEKHLSRYVCGLFPHSLGDMVGLGVGALSHIGDYHTQNVKILDKYLHTLNTKGHSPLIKTHKMSEEEISFRGIIRDAVQRGILKADKISLFSPKEQELWFIPKADFLEISPYGRFFLKNILQRIEGK